MSTNLRQTGLFPLTLTLFLTCSLFSLHPSGHSSATQPVPAASSADATDSVKSTVGELIRVLEDETLKAPDLAEQRREAIERVVMRRVSYEEMAKRALGTQWSQLDRRARREFIGLFVQLLRDTFTGRINDYADEEVVYLSEQREGQFAEVKTRLEGQKVDTQIDFRLMLVAGDWLVYDVVVDGASIVSNYRAQFATILRDVTYVGLVKQMRQKAVAVKVFERKSSPHGRRTQP